MKKHGWLILPIAALLAVIILALSILGAIHEVNQENENQKKCIASGGIYIHNRGMDSHCYPRK